MHLRFYMDLLKNLSLHDKENRFENGQDTATTLRDNNFKSFYYNQGLFWPDHDEYCWAETLTVFKFGLPNILFAAEKIGLYRITVSQKLQ